MISIRCVVENSAQRGSALWGEHGVSFAIETSAGRLLFDTGQSGEVLVHNAAHMGIRLDQFDALALSHAHYDHSGGLERFLIFARRGIPLYANASLFQERFAIKGSQVRSIGLRLSKVQLAPVVDFRLSADPVEILNGVWTTGEITSRSEFEGRSPQHFIRVDGDWSPDPYRDDLSLVLHAREGLVVICGCCHAGLLNTLAYIQGIFDRRILAIIGGIHWQNLDMATWDDAIVALGERFNGMVPDIHPCHCTGERAYLALARAFGEHVRPCPAGSAFIFE
ncbi:MAG: MBL fold metallo-hydrolase [Anaerolineales bacterium]|nr:MBL fold metallo-hydrolase [Anaerolineales bacterium]